MRVPTRRMRSVSTPASAASRCSKQELLIVKARFSPILLLQIEDTELTESEGYL